MPENDVIKNAAVVKGLPMTPDVEDWPGSPGIGAIVTKLLLITSDRKIF